MSDIAAAIIFDAVLLVAFLALLVKSAIFAVNAIAKFSKIVGISELVAGFVIVAITTSTPEISVAVFSVYTDNVGITLGDIFGSNVTNVALIAPILILASSLRRIEKSTVKKLIPLFIIASAIPILLLVAQQGSIFIGVALLALYGFFMYWSLKRNNSNEQANNINSEGKEQGSSAARQFLFFFIGIALVVTSAHFIVSSASAIAEMTGLRESVLGATIVALGTSLPELVVSIVSVRKRHLDLALGNIVGSSVTNIAMILGIVLVLTQAAIDFRILSTLIFFAVLAHAVLFVFLRSRRIARWQSIVLLAIYIAFLIAIYEVQIVIGGLRF
ncbi:MAG TPA: sodium:calcium antiporter [Nitrososphaera sp.]|nr:sodium:calcium antiporter [Nitrososphaera sp.]